jgi:hypothetical protein
MQIDVIRTHARAAGIAAALCAVALSLPPTLAAQSADPASAATDGQGGPDGQPVATADAQTGAQVPRPGTVTTVPSGETRSPWWELNGGYEGDSHATSYGFVGPGYVRPLGGKLAFKAHVYATQLKYEFANGLGGSTEVTAPGFSPAIGLRYGRKNWVQVTTGLDFKREHRQITDDVGDVFSDERHTRTGVSLGADAWWNPSRHSNVFTMLHYGTASKYTWGRIAAKQQVSNMDWHGPHTVYLGVEGVGQGNADIRSWQIGGLGELVFARSELSLQARGGYKRSTFEVGPDKSGPYFGVGLWKRF